MINIKYALGWTNFAVMFLIRIVVIVIGAVIVPVPQVIAFKRSQPKLPKMLWLWDNDEDSFYGARWYIDKMSGEGWGLVKISLVWNIIRNPANNLRYIGYGISPAEVDEILINTNSFDNVTNINDIATPTPDLVDDLPTKTYIQNGLLRSGWRYYPIFRRIKDKGDGTYTEIRIGFKYSPWWLKQVEFGRPISIHWQNRTPTVQYAHRDKSYWA